MAASCANCGAAVVPGMRACQFCGTPTGDVESAAQEIQLHEPPAAVAAPSLPAAVPASPAAAGPVNTGASPNGGPKKPRLPLALRITLPVLGIVFIFVLAWELRTMFSIFGSGSQLSTDPTPQAAESTSSFGNASTSDLGVDIYPNATALSRTFALTEG